MTAPAGLPGGFGARLTAAMQRHGRLCVGLDPHPGMLASWGLNDDASGLREFGRRVIAAAAGRAGVIKPQVAFFERYGTAGMRALAEIQHEAREAGLLVIADAKRGDIGSTMAAYAEAWLNPESEFAADALTVTPFLGFGSLAPAVEAAGRYGAGLFVLALTSNPEGQQVQLAAREEITVAEQIVRAVAQADTGRAAGQDGLTDIGLVVGATTASLAAEHGIDLTAGPVPILAPGYGAQGATAQSLREGFGPAYSQVLVNASRSILAAGPDPRALAEAVERTAAELG